MTDTRVYVDTQALARASEMDASPSPCPIETTGAAGKAYAVTLVAGKTVVAKV